NIVGSLLIAFAVDAAATPMIILGRILQGLAAGSIMPSTMALLKVYWDGAQRQRAVSMWSIGSWGGSGLTAIFGGFRRPPCWAGVRSSSSAPWSRWLRSR